MTKRNVLIAWVVVAALILLFPHWEVEGEKLTVSAGWGFLFSGKKVGYFSASVDVTLLLVMEAVAAALAVVGYRIARNDPKEED